jgi:hypothetical protein
LVQLAAQMNILKRTHQLLSEYIPLQDRWSQLWDVADVAAVDVNEWHNEAAGNSIDSILVMLRTAAFDSHAQTFLPDTSFAASKQVQQQQQQVVGSVIPEECGYSRCTSPFQQCQQAPHPDSGKQDLNGAAATSNVLEEVQNVLKPYQAFFGRQHLLALQQLGGYAALCMLREAALEMFKEEQVSFCKWCIRNSSY